MPITSEHLSLLDETGEVYIETMSSRGPIKTIIWIVVIDDQVYVRSVRGESGRWYERALADPSVSVHVGDHEMDFRAVPVEDPGEIEAVSQALREKYPPGGSLDRMTRNEVLDNTLRLEPAS